MYLYDVKFLGIGPGIGVPNCNPIYLGNGYKIVFQGEAYLKANKLQQKSWKHVSSGNPDFKPQFQGGKILGVEQNSFSFSLPLPEYFILHRYSEMLFMNAKT
jgi:hypothetical protein